VRVKGDFNARQKKFREALLADYVSPEFTKILENHGLDRPKDFVEGKTSE
jgi:hypothetical protein